MKKSSPARVQDLERKVEELANDLNESLEQQAATSEILRVISSSPTDIQPVLDAVAENAARLCDANDVIIRLVEGDAHRAVAHHGSIPIQPGMQVVRGGIAGRAILERRTIHVHDVQDGRTQAEFPGTHAVAGGYRTFLAAPLLREGSGIGTIIMRRLEVRPFTDRQIKLLETFAAQAVIAIENVRLFNETKEALQQQTATSEILRVISSSPTDVQPVFEAIVSSGVRLFEGAAVAVVLPDEGQVRLAAIAEADPARAERWRQLFPFPLSRDYMHGCAILERRLVDVPDVLQPGDTPEAGIKNFIPSGYRAVTIMPMIRDNAAIGAISVIRLAPGPLSNKQIALLKTFADQAVIAIENVRLFNETREALERQTATAEILKVISSSPTDTQPVFDAIVRNATSLCEGIYANVFRYDGELLHYVASHGWPPQLLQVLRTSYPMRPDQSRVAGRVILEKRAVRLEDTRSDADYDPDLARALEYRRILGIPMLRDGNVIGVITVGWAEPGPIQQRHEDLLKTFADQAVIAIENVRLFNETKEALEQQTVVSEILRVISSSPTDTQPVFEAIAKSGVHLFGGLTVSLRLVKGDRSELVASTFPIDTAGSNPLPLDDDSTPGTRAIHRQEVVRVPDILTEDWVSASMKQRGQQRDFRGIMCAPMLRNDNAIGSISVTRAAPGPFPDKQVKLLQTFASQAVIAIENARLFKELQARNAEISESLEQQTATSEILRVISSSPTDTQPVFDAVAESAARLCGAHDVVIRLVEGDVHRGVAHHGPIPVLPPRPVASGGISDRAMREALTVHIPDVAEAHARGELLDSRSFAAGHRSFLAVPLVREGTAIGAILMRRLEVRPFTDKQIKLLETFAAQAVIAIENVRLFKELQARNAQITESLEQQTATAEILRVISSSPTDLQPVFDAILENATRLCDAHLAFLNIYDGQKYRTVAERGASPQFAKWLTDRGAFEPAPEAGLGRVIAERQPIHVPDLREANMGGHAKTLVELGGVRTYLAVPILKEGSVLGAITIYRPEVRPFTEKQIDLVSTFANQAVIAIENVRLFKELGTRNEELTESLEQQTATSDILRVISSSPTDIQPVLDAVAESAARLCGAHDVVIRLVEGDVHRAVAHHGPIPVAPVRRVTSGAIASYAILNARTMHVPDVEEAIARGEFPETGATIGTRTCLAVPLVREGTAVGAILMRRLEVSPFSDKQIKLLETFAAQAVIAIENVRLFKELQTRNSELTESLEQQTATAEILRIISSSPTDVQPIFDTIARNADALCDSLFANVFRFDGELLHFVATSYTKPEAVELLRSLYPMRPNVSQVSGRVVLTKSVVRLEDALADPDYDHRFASIGAWRRMLGVPMVRDGIPLGAIVVGWEESGPIVRGHEELLKTFADQAVIAIENVRLFKELETRNRDLGESLQQQTATAEVLKVISRSAFDLQSVLQTLVESAARLCEADKATITRQKGHEFYRAEAYGFSQEFMEYVKDLPVEINRGTITGRVLLEGNVVQIPDIQLDPEYSWTEAQKLDTFRTVLGVPLLREGTPIGALALTRSEVEPFTQRQIELVRTFADQATIAIENVRLFNEIQDKSQQLEVANRHKSAFLASMSHELRTPLNAIIGFSEVLQERMFGEINEKQTEYLEDIHSSSIHLLSLINDILDLAKIEAGRMDLELSRFDLCSAIDNALTLIRERATRNNIALKLDCDARIGEWTADERKVKQIMLNLLSNAVKFTPSGGTISVRARRADQSVEIAVADTGAGISPEDQALVFEEFRQVGGDHLKKSEGTGLGLALTRKFVELHGGTITLNSEPGKGSTFTFTLPGKAAPSSR